MEPLALPGMPAPFWFVEFFKVVGFVLHLVPMGLWFAGLPIAVCCALWNCENSRRYANQMFGQFPILMALGINFGIVPLLFLQTTYYKPFYTATILTGWYWLSVIPILIIGYYALYIASYSRRTETFCFRTVAAGAVAALCLMTIGILITNGLTLLVRSDLWTELMERNNYYGAATGWANNFQDPAVWIRWTTMFALGLMTLAVWGQLFCNSSAGKYTAEKNKFYCRWNGYLSLILAVLAAGILTGTECIVKQTTAAAHVRMMYPYFGVILSFVYLTTALLFVSAFRTDNFYFRLSALLGHLLTLAGFGIIRQIGQNRGVASFIDVSKIPTDVQWSPLLAFLLLFVLGLAVIAWMVRQVFISSVPETR